jgi:hypothetical protein
MIVILCSTKILSPQEKEDIEERMDYVKLAEIKSVFVRVKKLTK